MRVRVYKINQTAVVEKRNTSYSFLPIREFLNTPLSSAVILNKGGRVAGKLSPRAITLWYTNFTKRV